MPFTGDIFSYTAGTSPGPASTVISSSKRSQRDADVEAAINTTTSVARGGTGSSTAAGALTNLGALPLAGGTMTGAIAGFESTGIDDNATSTAITIDSSENVGIGTTSPQSKLHASLSYSAPTGGHDGSLAGILSNSGSAGNYAGLEISSGSSGGSFIHFGDTDDSNVGGISYFHGANYMRFDTNGGEKVRIDSSGNVGIGTSTPEVNLHVEGATNGLIRVTADSSSVAGIDFGDPANRDAGRVRYNNANNSLAFSTADVERMAISSSGFVGIDESSPDARLHVNSGTTNTVAIFESTDAVAQIKLKDTTGTAVIRCENDFKFYTDDAASFHMAISSSGNVGIGNTSPADILEIGDYSATGSTNGKLFTDNGRILRSSVNTTANSTHQHFANPNGLLGSVNTNGSSTVYNTTSDYRLKVTFDEITDVGTQALAKVMAVPTRVQAFKADVAEAIANGEDPETVRQIGMLAHEVDAQVPWAVSGEKDAVDIDGDAVNQQVDYSKLTTVLWAAVQEQQKQIETLTLRVETLENA